jgi:hypothetical protein
MASRSTKTLLMNVSGNRITYPMLMTAAQDQAERRPRPREREGEREHEDDRGEDSERAAADMEAMRDRARAGLPPTS